MSFVRLNLLAAPEIPPTVWFDRVVSHGLKVLFWDTHLHRRLRLLTFEVVKHYPAI